uniref:Uncharacterized protein n=1 Tax=Arundo donax TaxID=35708 RepID=A0A0A9AHI5_ARUDO
MILITFYHLLQLNGCENMKRSTLCSNHFLVSQ